MPRSFACHGCLHLPLILPSGRKLYLQFNSHLLNIHYIPDPVLVTVGNTKTNELSISSLLCPLSWGLGGGYSIPWLKYISMLRLPIYFFSSTLFSDIQTHLHLPIFSSFNFLKRFYLFLERAGGRQGKKHQCVVASHTAPTGVLACNPGMCPDWESTSDPLLRRPVLNPLSHTSQGSICLCSTFIYVWSISKVMWPKLLTYSSPTHP